MKKEIKKAIADLREKGIGVTQVSNARMEDMEIKARIKLASGGYRTLVIEKLGGFTYLR